MSPTPLGPRLALLSAAALSALASPPAFIVAPERLAAAPYAQWAHSHFVWAEGSPNASECAALVESYLARNISVGGLDVDSGWSTGFNNFVVAPAFGDLAALTARMHALDVNVILWATALVNTDSPNFAEGQAKGFFLRDAFNETALVDWWHGRGAFLDYGNADALAWWEAAMDGVLAAGVDGWKVDGIDPFVLEVIGPTSRSGPVTIEQYQNWTASSAALPRATRPHFSPRLTLVPLSLLSLLSPSLSVSISSYLARLFSTATSSTTPAPCAAPRA